MGARKIAKVLREFRGGTLHSGSGGRVKSRRQAVAIALSEARRAGANIPKAPKRRPRRRPTGGRKRYS